MTTYVFDDQAVRWNQLEGIQHLSYSVLNINEGKNIAEVLFKFAANEKIILHRHKAPNNTFVIQGEHRLYEPNGDLKEVRPTGSYTVSPASDEPHREGGGDQDVIILFSIRSSEDLLYELLDEDQNLVGTLGMQDLIELHSAQV